MTAPSLKEALVARAQAFVDRKYVTRADARQKEMGLAYVEAERQDLAREIARFCTNEVKVALATLQPDGERREAIAFKIYSHSNNPKLWDRPNSVLARDNAYSIADLLLASGLVQDEAAIRRDEREKCAEIAETYRRKVVGRDMKEATFDPAGRWEGGAVYDAPTIQSGIASAIRSARDGGEV